MINNRRAFIVGLKGATLSKKEIFFLKHYKPWGVILFSRNIKSIQQVQLLVSNIHSLFKDINFPILIDQEGGEVCRLDNILTARPFSASFYGSIYEKDKKNLNLYINIYVDQISSLMRTLGINMNNFPVLDLKRNSSHSIIKKRAFSKKPKVVKCIGNLFIKKYQENKISCVIKHIPGHGLAKKDSHVSTPVVKKNLNYLMKNDFYPFKKHNALFAMTAHIIYESIDKHYTATHSKKIINIIRNKIKFKNIIMSDDISMKSLKFSLKENTLKSFNAGCNIVLHCNGKLSEMLVVAKNSPKLDSFLMKKTSEFYKLIS